VSHSRRVVVVGGGISGLTTAYRLAAAGVDVSVREASDRPGGKLATTPVGDLLLEAGADSFVARKPWAVDLCRDLGLAEELVTPAAKGAYLWTDHGLVAFPSDAPFGIPGDIAGVFRWPGLSRAGRRRAAQDLVRGKRKDGVEETLGGLLRRRLGDEATDLAVAPLLAGLYAGDVDRLSARATFPELLTWESTQASLIRGSQAAMRSARRGSPTPMFVRPKGGVGRLAHALAATLGDRVVAGAPVGSLAELGEGGGDAFAIVLAVPAFEAARLVASTTPSAAVELGAIPYASTGVVFLVYGDGTQAAMPDGTGFVVPRGKAPMSACTWISSKWPDPAFGSRAVLRCYVGGVGEDDVLDAPDEELVDACARHVAAVLDLPSRPQASSVVRWIRAMPQYEVGHGEQVRAIRRDLGEGVFVVGSAYDGVGIADCVRAAGETAEHVLRHLDHTTIEKETAR
jgi:protoporphyrinogen/coproporphyrinogen III oxidase